jgi:hypothetical protein
MTPFDLIFVFHRMVKHQKDDDMIGGRLIVLDAVEGLCTGDLEGRV